MLAQFKISFGLQVIEPEPGIKKPGCLFLKLATRRRVFSYLFLPSHTVILLSLFFPSNVDPSSPAAADHSRIYSLRFSFFSSRSLDSQILFLASSTLDSRTQTLSSSGVLLHSHISFFFGIHSVHLSDFWSLEFRFSSASNNVLKLLSLFELFSEYLAM